MKKFVFALAFLLPTAAFAWGHCSFGGPMSCGPMMPPVSGGSKIAPLLVAMAAGYAVLTLAVRQTRKLSLLGLILGGFILAVSAAGVGCVAGRALCARFHRADACAPAGACPFMSRNNPCMAPADNQADDKKTETPKPDKKK